MVNDQTKWLVLGLELSLLLSNCHIELLGFETVEVIKARASGRRSLFYYEKNLFLFVFFLYFFSRFSLAYGLLRLPYLLPNCNG